MKGRVCVSEEKYIHWRRNGKCGIAQVKLVARWSRRHGLVRYVGLRNWRGDRLPAWLLRPVLDRALGPEWRARPHAEGPHPPCADPEVVHFPHSGRIQIRCGSPRGTLRISPNGSVGDFELPLKRLALMIGRGGLLSLFPQEEAVIEPCVLVTADGREECVMEEVDWRWGEEPWPYPERDDLVPVWL